MAYFTRHGLGATGSTASSSAFTEAKNKIAAFASIAKTEAERCFAATKLHMDTDAERRDDVITTTSRAASDAKAALPADPAKAKTLIDTAMARAASVLPQIKDVADVAKVQTAANAAKSAIDAAVVAAAAAAKAASRSSSSSVPASVPLTPPVEISSGSSFPLSPLQIAAVVGIAVLLLLPKPKRA